MVTRKQLLTSFEEKLGEVQTTRIADIASTETTVAFADEPLGVVVPGKNGEVGFDPFFRSWIPTTWDGLSA